MSVKKPEKGPCNNCEYAIWHTIGKAFDSDDQKTQCYCLLMHCISYNPGGYGPGNDPYMIGECQKPGRTI